jgi:hypothetical protein
MSYGSDLKMLVVPNKIYRWVKIESASLTIES